MLTKTLFYINFLLNNYIFVLVNLNLNKMKYIYLLIILLFVSINSMSQTIITDRPDQTESSSTIEIGSIQIESGVLIIENDSHREKNLYLPTTLFRLGLTNTIELRVLNEFEYKIYETHSINGFNDLEIGVKLQLLQKEDVATELAFLSHVVLPTASQFFSEEKFGVINKLCVSHESNGNIGVGYNVGYNYYENRTGDFTYSFVLGFEITNKLNAYLEPYGEIVDLERSMSNINMGITYLLQDNIQLDYSFGTGINHTFNFMSIGCSLQIF